MPNHYWGDEDFDWKALYAAQNYIDDYVHRYSRCLLVSKEKYGTIRYEYIFPPGTACYIKKDFLIERIYKAISPKREYKYLNPGDKYQIWHWHDSWLCRKWRLFGWKMCWRAVQKAAKKWPHVKDELYEDIASQEWLVGQEIKSQYWR